MTDENGLWTPPDEPSAEDFETAEDDQPAAGARSPLVRLIRLVGVLILILALLIYFVVVPFRYVLTSVPYRWLRPGTGPHTIPLAPERRESPKLPA